MILRKIESHQACMQVNAHYPWVYGPDHMVPYGCVSIRVGPWSDYVINCHGLTRITSSLWSLLDIYELVLQ